MAYANADTKLIRQVSVIDDTKTPVLLLQVQPTNTVIGALSGDVSLSAVEGRVTVESGPATGAANAEDVVLAAGQAVNGAGGDVQITAGAASGAGAGGDILLAPGASATGLRGEVGVAGPISYSIDTVGSAGAISGSANPLVRLTAGGAYTLQAPSASLAGRQITIFNDQAVAAVFTTLAGVTNVSLAEDEALTVVCSGTAWIIVSTTGTVTP